MSEIIHVNDQFYILATASLADMPRRVLKHGETFAVFDQYGDMRPIGQGELGLYHEDTRFLSRWQLRLGDRRPLLLSSSVRVDNLLLAVDLTNPDISRDDEVVLPHSSVHLSRIILLSQAAAYERIRIANYHYAPLTLTLRLDFDADFIDMFEVRGASRTQHGQRQSPLVGQDQVTLSYIGLDQVRRATQISFTPAPAELTAAYAAFTLTLPPKAESMLYITAACRSGSSVAPQQTFSGALDAAEGALAASRREHCTIITSNDQFNSWLNRSMADLHMMISRTDTGPYPYAGVPWFNTVFGRDGIITALEALWFNPAIARGVLAYLAKTQATQVDAFQDAEPGKILHETRRGEMAALGEIPFSRYYGGVDTTLLFIMLAGAYYEHSADKDFVKSIWPNIERALAWIDNYGDYDGDGFVEYARGTDKGLVNQGWKDSHDSIFHADGQLAEGPIALCEVQSYVYAARRSAAMIAAALGHPERAAALLDAADLLQQRFEEAFWCEELSTYALALDGNKQPCRVRSSNAGHCLFAGIAEPARARRTAATLLDPQSFSGWGVRTIPSSEARYNPMSYHNGSIWPHDNALIAAGLARYGFIEQAQTLLAGLFEASLFLDLYRLPELFCGFHRRSGEGPTLYPVACAPQAWAIAAVFMLIQASLGLTVDGTRSQVRFNRPRLPTFLNMVEMRGLRVGNGMVDLVFNRHQHEVGVDVTQRSGDIEVIVMK